MKRSTRVLIQFLLCLSASSTFSQIRQIDRSNFRKTVLLKAPIPIYCQSINTLARTKRNGAFLSERRRGLAISAFSPHARKRTETGTRKQGTQLFTGLVAHLAYNLDIEEAYDPAMKLLQSLADEDFRAAWFLGIHQCQSNNAVGGMQQLLRVETSSTSLPGAFWQDYANCASVTFMPATPSAHMTSPMRPTVDQSTLSLNKSHGTESSQSSNTNVYTDRQAWYGD